MYSDRNKNGLLAQCNYASIVDRYPEEEERTRSNTIETRSVSRS
jgi:hypothetical protein